MNVGAFAGTSRGMKATLVALTVVLTACEPAGPGARTPSSSGPVIDGGVARYLPARGDVVLAYKTLEVDTGASGVAMMRVVPQGTDHAQITGGKTPTAVVYEAKGIRRVPEDTYLLVWPPDEGRTWPMGALATARIRTASAKVTVAAGTFERCIEVVEERKSPTASAVIVTTFCPDVGIVLIDADGGETGHERLELTSAQKAVSIDDVK